MTDTEQPTTEQQTIKDSKKKEAVQKEYNNKKHYTHEELVDFLDHPKHMRHRSSKFHGVWIKEPNDIKDSELPKPLLQKLTVAGKILFTTEGDKIKFLVDEKIIDDVLEWMYNEATIGLQGRDKLTEKVYERFHGITKVDVANYLKSNQVHQLHGALHKKRVVKPIVIKEPGKHFQVDITYWTALKGYNNGYAFMLTMVDLNSKFVMLDKMTNIKSNTIANSLKRMIDSLPNKPRVIQSDNGPEFQGEVDKLLMNEGIMHITSTSHTPQSQGEVERTQASIKTMISRWMTLNNTKRWIDVIDDIQKNINSSKHRITGKQPNKILDPQAKQQDKDKALQGIKEQASKTLKQQDKRFTPLQIGDWVRISILEVDHQQRAQALQGHRKPASAVNYTRDLYKIIKIKKMKTGTQMFKVEHEDDGVIDGWYYRDRLLKSVAPEQERNKAKKQSNDVEDVIRQQNDEKLRRTEETLNREENKISDNRDQKAIDDLRLQREAIIEADKQEPIAARLNQRIRKKPDRLTY